MKTDGFTDHGTVAMADEVRGAALVLANDGETYYVICSRGYVLSVKLNTKEIKQALFPENYLGDTAPFAVLGSSAGLFYTGSGKMFMEYDPVTNLFTYYSKEWPEELNVGFRLMESRSGLVYIASHPTCRLSAYNPNTRTIIDYGCMDESEKYIAYIVEDAGGWLYMGIGTERRAMVAFNPLTNEKRQYLAESERTQGCGYFHKGEDGRVYGHPQNELDPYNGKFVWKRYLKGHAEDVHESQVSPLAKNYAGFYYSWGIHSPGTDPDRIKKLNLNDRELVYVNSSTGRETSLHLDCFSYGAQLGRMIGGPDGKLYGCSCHPFHFYNYDPKSKQITDYGESFGRFICAYAAQGSVIVGASYTNGYIVHFDTSRPVTRLQGMENPSTIGNYDEIYRPRSAAAHPDGKRMIFGGFGGYGASGGGLCVYNAESQEHFAIPNHELVPYQSTVCMRFLPDSDLICGNSIETPGGASPKTKEAEIFRFNLETRKIVYRVAPIPGAREISVCELDNAGLLHCIASDSIYSTTSNSIYFVFDPETRKIIYSRKIVEFGIPILGGMARCEDGMIYGIMTRAIYRIAPDKPAFEILAVPPVDISAGMAIINQVLYFGAAAKLWSHRI